MDVIGIISDKFTLCAYLQFNNLILSSKICTKCNVQCKFQERDDKFFFRCPINKCRQVFTVSPKNFWLSKTRIPYNNFIVIVFALGKYYNYMSDRPRERL